MGVAEPVSASDGALRTQSIEVLFGALEAPLLRYARCLLSDDNVAEEIVQEAFVRLHGQSDGVRDPRSWLFRTVHNLALNHKRKTARIVPLEQDGGARSSPMAEPVDGHPSPDEELMRIEGIGFVRLGLEGLDARSRELIMLKFYDGLSYKEISARTGLSVGHVGYLLHHALKKLTADLVRAGLVK